MRLSRLWYFVGDVLAAALSLLLAPLTRLWRPDARTSIEADAIGREAGTEPARAMPFIAFVKRALSHAEYSGGGFGSVGISLA